MVTSSDYYIITTNIVLVPNVDNYHCNDYCYHLRSCTLQVVVQSENLMPNSQTCIVLNLVLIRNLVSSMYSIDRVRNWRFYGACR